MERIERLDEQTAARLDGQKQLLAEARARRKEHGSYTTYGQVEVERHHVAAAPSNGTMHVNLDGLEKTAEKLTEILALLRRYQRTADRLHVLSHRMRDGHGPVSEMMRALFARRAGGEEGLLRVLHNYEQALLRVQAEIRDAAHRYRQAEEESVRSLRIAAEHLDTARQDAARQDTAPALVPESLDSAAASASGIAVRQEV